MATSRNAGGVARPGRRRSGACFVLLCALCLLSPAVLADRPFEVVFEAEVTVGQSGFSSVDPDDAVLRQARVERQGGGVRLSLAGTADADSVFDRMRITRDDGRTHTFRRAQGYGPDRDDPDRDADDAYWAGNFFRGVWYWYNGGDIVPTTAGETYTLAFSRPPANCDAVYTATVTTGNGKGYKRPPQGYGSIGDDPTDPDIGEVMRIERSAGGVNLVLPSGTKNQDDVFRTMRLSRGGHFWDFWRADAAYRSFSRFGWDYDDHAIPDTNGETFTLAFRDALCTTVQCVWRLRGNCTGGKQALRPVAGHWEDDGKLWTWTPATGCRSFVEGVDKPERIEPNCALKWNEEKCTTAPGPKPDPMNLPCPGASAGVCKFQGEDIKTDGNIGCFHRY